MQNSSPTAKWETRSSQNATAIDETERALKTRSQIWSEPLVIDDRGYGSGDASCDSFIIISNVSWSHRNWDRTLLRKMAAAVYEYSYAYGIATSVPIDYGPPVGSFHHGSSEISPPYAHHNPSSSGGGVNPLVTISTNTPADSVLPRHQGKVHSRPVISRGCDACVVMVTEISLDLSGERRLRARGRAPGLTAGAVAVAGAG
jgi:hypothetical protein